MERVSACRFPQDHYSPKPFNETWKGWSISKDLFVRMVENGDISVESTNWKLLTRYCEHESVYDRCNNLYCPYAHRYTYDYVEKLLPEPEQAATVVERPKVNIIEVFKSFNLFSKPAIPYDDVMDKIIEEHKPIENLELNKTFVDYINRRYRNLEARYTGLCRCDSDRGRCRAAYRKYLEKRERVSERERA